MADAPPPPPPALKLPPPRPEPREAVRSRVDAFRAQVRTDYLPQFALPGVAPEKGKCWSCAAPSAEVRCPLCAEAARHVVDDLQHVRAVAAYEKQQAALAAKAAEAKPK
jgi:hypothetical protein